MFIIRHMEQKPKLTKMEIFIDTKRKLFSEKKSLKSNRLMLKIINKNQEKP